jgi:hypothetical protein
MSIAKQKHGMCTTTTPLSATEENYLFERETKTLTAG